MKAPLARAVGLLACSLTLFPPFGVPALAGSGDITGDGALDVRDVLLLEKHLRTGVGLSAPQLLAADVAPLNESGPAPDGLVDAGDLVVLTRLAAAPDLDGDGLSNDFELTHGFSLFVADEDGNGVLDGLDDWDQDGLINRDEEQFDFDPLDPDSDGDGVYDALELAPVPSPAVASNASTSSQFLYEGASTGSQTPLQTEAEPAEFDELILAVLRGKVKSRTGVAVGGVTVRVLGHPEYGETRTRADGFFDLAVNGGGTLTVVYDSPDHLTLQRKVTVPWQDYVFLPEVVLTPLDTVYQDIVPANISSIAVARGSVSTDPAGTRQPTLLFRQGTLVTATLPDDTTQVLPQLRVRATEYTVGDSGPEAMPGDLPPQSAYTYAVEYTVDEARALGAKKVSFSQPVSSYLENFLHFPVGTTMPNGYYDVEKGAWLAEPSGIVLKIVGVASGRVELDITGDGLADNVASLGISDDERAALVAVYANPLPPNPDDYPQLWWVPLYHFSDYNQAPAFPANSQPPGTPVPLGEAPPGPCEEANASTIVCESQTLLETIPVPDTPFALSYASDRTPGYTAAYSLRFPLRGTSMLDPEEVLRVELDVNVAGRRYRYDYAPGTVNDNAVQAVPWDGRDAYGRPLQGRQPVTAVLTYEYGFGYQNAPAFGQAGNGIAIANLSPRTRMRVRQPWYGFIGGWDARGAGLGGWTLSPHHSYDPYSRVLYTGDGRQRRAEQLPDVIQTVAGNGSIGTLPPDGENEVAATDAVIGNPRSVAAAPDGSFLVAASARIHRIDRRGMITRFALGKPTPYPASLLTGDGVPAVDSKCNDLKGLAVASDGSVYFACAGGDDRVRKITPDGLVWTVAGQYSQNATGSTWPYEGQQATAAKLGTLEDIALAPDGTLYIADSYFNRVFRVAPNGIITTVAGSGNGGLVSDDGVPATEAVLLGVEGLALDAAGNLYISSFASHRVWRVAPDGILTRFAGTGATKTALEQSIGDGAAATEAILESPRAVAAGRDGSVYIATNGGGGFPENRVRRVAPNGLITTVAGTGPKGLNGAGGPAAVALLHGPSGLAVAADGAIYVANFGDGAGNRTISKIGPAFPGAAAGTLTIPSEDGSERYEFDSSGKHLKTYETVRNTVLYDFDYDAEDRLIYITDGDDNVTEIEHDAQGVPLAIVAPFGQRTELEVDANGWLSAVVDAASGRHELTTGTTGLLTGYRDPKGQSAIYEYGDYGYLEKDTDRAGGWKQLARTDSAGVSEVTMTTRLARTTTYRTERDAQSGLETRTITDAAGLATTMLRDEKENRTVTTATGVQTQTEPGPDFRFGLSAPIVKTQTVSTPGGRVRVVERTRTGAMDASTGELTTQTDTTLVNSRTHTAVWNHATPVPWNGDSPGLLQMESPENRILQVALDGRGRRIGSRLGSLHPVKVSYDSRGRIETVTQGQGDASDRVTTFAYNPTTGRLAQITDPLNRTTSFGLYDAAGRVKQLTLPGSRTLGFDYDANGQRTELTPPGRPSHVFDYNPVGLESEYEPPTVPGIPSPSTIYTYDFDRGLDFVTRPDGKNVDPVFEVSTGRLASITTSEGEYTYSYYPLTPQTGDPDGQLASLTAPGGQTLSYTWDGSLPMSTTWSGPVAGSVSRTFDDDFRLEAELVNGSHTVSYAYDDDSLVTGVTPATGPALVLTRDAGIGFGAGLVTGTSQDLVTTSEIPSAFGELATRTASVSGTPIYGLDISDRDALGRIETRVETVGGVTTTSVYAYDAAGRLDTVTRGGTLVADYGYDANGNRLHEREDLAGPPIGVYDDQDRLLAYGSASYTYSAGGDLETRSDGTGTTTYAYDALGSLRDVTFPDGKKVEYVIDGQQRRVGKKVCAAPCTGGATAQPVQGLLYADGLRIAAELDAANQVVSRFVYATQRHVPDFLVKAANTYRLITDQVGSVRLVVDTATGAVAQRIDYDEWGHVTADTSPGFQPFGFAGGLTDADTGLVRFGARDYDPQTGRWTAKDPIGFGGGDTILYGYVGGDPVNLVDPTGENPLLIAAGMIAAAGAIGIGVPLGVGAALDDECGFEDTKRAAAQAATVVFGLAGAAGLAGGAVEAAPAAAAAGLASAGALTQAAANNLPRLPHALEKVVDSADDALDAAGDALGNLFGPTPDCGCKLPR